MGNETVEQVWSVSLCSGRVQVGPCRQVQGAGHEPLHSVPLPTHPSRAVRAHTLVLQTQRCGEKVRMGVTASSSVSCSMTLVGPALDERPCQLVRQLVKFSCQEQATWILLHLPTAPRSLSESRGLAQQLSIFFLLLLLLRGLTHFLDPHTHILLSCTTLELP